MTKHHRFLLIASLFICLVACNTSDTPDAAPERKPVTDFNPSPTFMTPEESMKTMRLPAGYHLELVASEPDIQEPVAIAWDGNGRMYVAEMRSYMQDVEGTGEHLPICQISRFEDTNGDGKLDKHTVFIDSLVLPRMMLPLDDRLVVNETYSFNMHSYRDTNGDGKADEKKLVYHNDTADNANLEHQKSGLIWNIDNHIYVTYSPVRYQYDNGMLRADSMSEGPGGQWGLGNDDYGRLYYSSAGGEVPALNFQQNPVYGQLDLPDQRENDFDAVWPIIATPDVQGGKERLREDSTLNHFTASCGQSVFRGDRLPANMKGDLFICEPVGRLIRRAKVSTRNGETYLSNAYNKAEFLTSSDMNFRPVNTVTGPDGCLYIVDMYHGIIQESAWTKADSYIRPQIQKRGLDKHIGRGRIYRLVHDKYTPGPQPKLLDASANELVKTLSHPNGWWRETAQKLLVIRGDQSVVPQLENLALGKSTIWQKLAFWQSKPPAVTRIHALWTLDGLHAITKDLLLQAFKDESPEVRAAAIRISENYLKQQDANMFSALEHFKTDTSGTVKIQLAQSLRYIRLPQAKTLLQELMKDNARSKLMQLVAEKSQEETDEAFIQLKESVASLPERDRKLILHGADNFKQLCATCHGQDGKGLPSMIAPPLAGSARVNADKNTVIRILLNGLQGPVDGKKYPDVMPAQNANTDQYIASVLSYIRNSLGNHADIVYPDDIKKIRAENKDRQKAWTLEDLKVIGK